MEKWDLFEIFDAREDNYTNMLHFLYETEHSFRAKFLKLIFGKDVEGVVFKTRTVYRRENAGKNIPDIILYNENYFAIIEVKLFSGEGYKQTERYYEASVDIMKALAVRNQCEQRYFFLTINGTKPECDAFQPLLWKDVSECMNPDDCGNEMAELLMGQFKDRIRSMNQKNILLDGLWEEQVHSYLWSGAIRFYAALDYLFKQLDTEEWFKDNNIKWYGRQWTGFNQASNSYAHSAAFYPEDGRWQGKTLEKALEANDASSCYDYHFEFQWDEATNLLTMRLDYHLNPYMSKKYITGMKDEQLKKFAKACNNERAKKARENKQKWIYMAPEDYWGCYNSRIGLDLMTLVTKEYKHNELKGSTVRNVLALIRPFIEIGTKYITEYFLPVGKTLNKE